jgi:hypothetical protein
MRQKTIDIPIYGGKITMILTDDMSKVFDKYKSIKRLPNARAITFKDDTKYLHIVVALESDWRVNVVHEVVHIVNHIYLDRSMELDIYNDEPQAYLTGWVYQQIDNFLETNQTKVNG